MSNRDILQQIQEADMLLVGIGEEFDNVRALKSKSGYSECREKLGCSEEAWLLPALNLIYQKEEPEVYKVLSRFAELIAGKNYFVVSVSTNDLIRRVAWRENRLVMPCGGSLLKQCPRNCENGLMKVTDNDWEAIHDYTNKLLDEKILQEENIINLGVCPDCGSPLVLNNIYTEKYDENGYLGQWKLYTKWLQGTLNRKLMILELGVGMQCPSVIRWPFEKIAYFNQKASFYRVNETLYQLSEELKEKGTSISQNAIDWLGFLC